MHNHNHNSLSACDAYRKMPCALIMAYALSNLVHQSVCRPYYALCIMNYALPKRTQS